MAEIDKNPRQITRLRVEDQVKLEKLASSTSFDANDILQIDSNLRVAGNVETLGLSIWESGQNEQAFLEYQYDSDNFRLINYNTNATTNIPLADNAELSVVTNETIPDYLNMNLKTLFGNQSLVGSGNIDLYKHYLEISAEPSEGGTGAQCNILIQSSSNVDCSSATGATQKLKDLLKISGTSYRVYESGVASSGAISCALVWTGTTLQVNVGGTPYVIKSIVDVVETV